MDHYGSGRLPQRARRGAGRRFGRGQESVRMFTRVSIGTLDASSQVTTGTFSVGMQMRKGQKPAQEKSERKH